MPAIEQFSPEQRLVAREIEERWKQLLASTAPVNRDQAMETVRRCGYPAETEFVWIESLKHGYLGARSSRGAIDHDVSHAFSEHGAIVGNACGNRALTELSNIYRRLYRFPLSIGRCLPAYYDIVQALDIAPLPEPCRAIIELAKQVWIFGRGSMGRPSPIYLCERPAELHLRGTQLHRIDGPALVWRDGKSQWYVSGLSFNPETASKTDAELVAYCHTNTADPAAQMLEWYGLERSFHIEALGKMLPGTRGRMRQIRTHHGWLGIVEVKDPSTGQMYYLLTPGWNPTAPGAQNASLWSADAAIAWTFGCVDPALSQVASYRVALGRIQRVYAPLIET